MIPKIIHYCWLSNEPVPEEFAKYMETWKKHLSDYEFMQWDFDRFDKKSSKWVSQSFDNKKYAFAADYIRLFAIYNYGGIYLDMDIEVLKSFDDLLKSEYMMAYEREGAKFVEAGCMGAEKKSPFIKDVLDYYINREFIKENGEYDMLPLPKIMAQILCKKDYGISFMDWHTFTNKSYATGDVMPVERSYSIHHFSGSWKTPKEIRFNAFKQKISKKLGSNFTRNILFTSLEVIYCHGVGKFIKKIRNKIFK